MNDLIANRRHIYGIIIASIDSKGIPRRGRPALVQKLGRKSGGEPKPFCRRLRTAKEDQAASFAEVNE
jgi:hypothetical protein